MGIGISVTTSGEGEALLSPSAAWGVSVGAAAANAVVMTPPSSRAIAHKVQKMRFIVPVLLLIFCRSWRGEKWEHPFHAGAVPYHAGLAAL